MGTTIRNALTVLGGGGSGWLTVGFGGTGVSPTGSATTPATHPSSGVATMPTGAPTPGVHVAALTGCIPGANC
jgi:hypothetical protein